MADKDIREEIGLPDEVPPSEGRSSEGGPAARAPEPFSADEAAPPVTSDRIAADGPAEAADLRPDPPSAAEFEEEVLPATEVEEPAAAPSPDAASDSVEPVPHEDVAPAALSDLEPAIDLLASEEALQAGELATDVDEPASAAPFPEAASDTAGPSPHENVAPAALSNLEPATDIPAVKGSQADDPAGDPEPEATPDVVVDAEPWRSAIADALVEPPVSEAQGDDLSADQEEAPESVPETPPAEANPAFTIAAEDLFRPPAIQEEPHLITLGRRLNSSLSVPRPVLPDIAPRPEADDAPASRWREWPWKDRLWTALRYAGYAIGGYLALVLVLIVLFRFVNPPGSMLMLAQFLTGTAITRTWVPLESISSNLVRAVIVSEDGRFCEHSGIDTAAIKEAIERASRGTPRGASTISMQVTKNLFLWNAKSYVRKVIEIPLTLYMEIIWPKRRVLEVYLNIAEWGPGVFGAEAAARRHFGKSAAQLDGREAALLAAVLPNPVVRDAGSPNQLTSAKARVVQSRVKAYGAVASCVTPFAAAAPAAAAPPKVKTPSAIRKVPPRPAPRKKQPANDWAPILNFGPN